MVMIRASILVAVATWLAAGETPPPPLAPPPPAEQVSASIKQLRQTLRADYASREADLRRALVLRLIELGATGESAARYAALREAIEQAARLGDPALVDQAVDALAAAFAIERHAERLSAYVAAAAGTPPDRFVPLLDAVLRLVDEAVAADGYPVALMAAQQAEAMARKMRDPALAARCRALVARQKELADEWQRVGSLEDLLGESDPAAARRLARFRCLFLGNWAADLSRLIDHEDQELQAAARAELAAQTPEQRLAVAVTWAEYGKRQRGLARENCLHHAVDLLRQSLPDANPAQRTQGERRLAEYARLLGVSARMPAIPAGAVLYLTCERDTLADGGGRETVQDLTGNGFHGRITGARSTVGAFGGALEFTAPEDAVDLGRAPAQRLATSLTMAMWLRPAQLGARRNPLAIDYEGVGTITLEPAGNLHYYCAGDGPYQSFPSGFSVAVDAWSHIAVVRDGQAKTVTWYHNGVAATTASTTIAVARITPAPVILGHGYAGPFVGLIDEVGLWARPLTAVEITALVAVTRAGR